MGMLKSLRGKATSEWSSWILAYEHTLRTKYNDLFVNRLDLDLNELRLRCERGDNPIELANKDVIPLMSSRTRARVAMERQKIREEIEHIRSARRTKSVQQICVLLGLAIVALTGYLSYGHWANISELRAQEQARIEWRQSVGLR
jgi:hypothetical protein